MRIRNRNRLRIRLALSAAAALAASGLVAPPAMAEAPAWRILGAVGPTHLPSVTSEVNRVEVDATGGTYTLSFETAATGPIDFDASAAEVAAALNGLSTIQGVGGTVEVSGGPGDAGATNPYFVRFGGTFTGDNLASSLVADDTLLSGGGASATVDVETEGGEPGEGSLAVYPTNIGGLATSASISISIGPLPAGITTAGAAIGNGWVCAGSGPGQTSVNCERAAPLAALATADPVKVPLEVGPAAAAASSVPVAVTGGGAVADPSNRNAQQVPVVVSNEDAKPGVQAFWAEAWDKDGDVVVDAGSHPNAAGTMFLLNTILAPSGNIVPAGDLRDAMVELPPGFVGNPTVTNRCPRTLAGSCGPQAYVGDAKPITQLFGGDVGSAPVPILNDMPARGYAAQFTFKIVDALASTVAELRSDEDYGVTITAPNVTPFYRVFGSVFVLEGTPPASAGKAFLTAPTGCATEALLPPFTDILTNTWQVPGVIDAERAPIPPVTECKNLSFGGDDDVDPEVAFDFQPGAKSAATATAAQALLNLDQSELTNPNELATPHLKTSVVTLPQGMVLNPSAANGLQACSSAQIGLRGTGFSAPNPIRFNLDPVRCPDGSKIGTVEVITPLLEQPLNGTVYLAAQGDNPFNSLLAMYLVVEDEETGVVIKLPGKVTPNPVTGQLTAEFDNNPQTPFESLDLRFRGGGPRSTMATPDVCGTYTTTGAFTPWSAPESGPPAVTRDSFTIGTGVGGSTACPQTKAQRPFGLGFEAGSTNPVAGAHSPFTLRITRPDGNQELSTISLSTPPGFAATLKGVAVCSDAQLAQALARSNPGDGAAELANPSCPAASQVGTTTIGAGVGSEPFFVKTGKVYRTGAYKGAKQSLTFVVPAVAGPFDLGVQVVRTALQVNPLTAQITAVSDPIPQVLQGIPLQIREIRVDIDRPGFTINPTNCDPMSVSAQVGGGSGAVANVSSRFQVGNCGALAFKPKLKLTYKGATKRSGNPALRAELTQLPGQANISRTVVLLPKGTLIDQAHVNNPCTRAQFAASACPRKSIVGRATAWSPLLDQPLSGNVYFRSNGGARTLPDIVAVLQGEVDVELVGFIDAVENKKAGTSRVRNTFAIVPDAPVSKFVLNMKGGKVGLIENGKNLCKQKNRATVKMKAHNGRPLSSKPAIKVRCKKPKK